MFNSISNKQFISWAWWRLEQFKDKNVMIAHGAIRTGKTTFVAFGFFDWIEHTVKNTDKDKRLTGWNNFAVIATTKDTAYDNVIVPIIEYITQNKGYREVYKFKDLVYDKCFYHAGDRGALIVNNGNDTFRIKYLGAHSKMAVKTIQGRTLRGTMIDEAGLIEEELLEKIRGRHITFKDHKLFQTSNPEGDDAHPYYVSYIKKGEEKRHLVLNFNLLDNPVFDQEDVDYYQKIFTPEMFKRNVLGLWVRGKGVIYKRFEESRHLFNLWKTFEPRDYTELVVGVDYGEVDATVFQLIGIRPRLVGIDVLKEYYHKGSDGVEKNINEYVDDFFKFISKIRDRYKKTIKVNVESATHGRSFYKLIKARVQQQGWQWLRVSLVDKSAQMKKGTIRERIDALNLMLGSDFIRIDKGCENLRLSIKRASWKKDKEERLDDGTTNIDSLDALEYAFINYIPKIIKKIEYMGGKT